MRYMKKPKELVLVWTLREFCENKKDIHNAYQLHLRTGLTYPITRKLWSGEQKQVALATLTTICNALDCKLVDLIDWREAPT
jgi:DNA-binding Xre family transcriptional regulator